MANSSHKETFFLEINNPFSIKPSVVLVKISEKNINFSGLKSFYLFQSVRNNGDEIWAFDATWGISR